MSSIVQSANATIKKQLEAERKTTYIYVAKQARDIENQKNERYLEAWGERIYQREKQGL
ncbi:MULTISPECIES: hypothetical protein [Pasteurellaceae]|uniref:Uncharacterized protein n=1 Tax=Pasteurella atlantica TaxID=2827233 RepID=A0AAW8CQJ6_9PAST|nr:hypothetical protein [Pasteurella atlantica]MBR0573706.1 hypothetical protein [Pasteurella atlantica]MDP8039659.1 hypothetical protein [Pasteurella atlantica]MDP8041750.1 hypothetical protein [Pasteurella atlantica]MDP8043976.1 hypothetical protein [Pasteurella atlantica]MDP8045954.1 hypothetical protein [Pasteurella atlantica]